MKSPPRSSTALTILAPRVIEERLAAEARRQSVLACARHSDAEVLELIQAEVLEFIEQAAWPTKS